jgi:hypothetical protein
MGLFDFFKKKESVIVNTPIKEVKSEQISETEYTKKVISLNENQNISGMGFSSIYLVEGFNNNIEHSEIVDFDIHEEVSEEAKKLTIDYVNSLKGQVFYSHKKFYKLQESPYKCKDKDKTPVWLYNLIKYKLITVGCRYDGKVLIEFYCKEMPELNCLNKEKLITIAKEMKSN